MRLFKKNQNSPAIQQLANIIKESSSHKRDEKHSRKDKQVNKMLEDLNRLNLNEEEESDGDIGRALAR